MAAEPTVADLAVASLEWGPVGYIVLTAFPHEGMIGPREPAKVYADRAEAEAEEKAREKVNAEGRLIEFGQVVEIALPVAALVDLDAKKLGPFVKDSATSRAAAIAAYPRQGTQRHRIVRCLYERARGRA